MMTSNGSTQILHEGISMWIPKGWDFNIDTYDEAEGSKSHCLSMAARGKDTRSIDISWGTIPDGSNAYSQACSTYEEVVGEWDLSINDEPIIGFEFQGHEAYGFSVYTDNGLPCFFFCVDMPSLGNNHMITVLACASTDEYLQALICFTEEHLNVE